MKKIAEKSLQDKGFSFDSIGVPGSFEIPYEIARSIKQETLDKENNIGIFKGKDKDKMRYKIGIIKAIKARSIVYLFGFSSIRMYY